jgi:hypothetical protein
VTSCILSLDKHRVITDVTYHFHCYCCGIQAGSAISELRNAVDTLIIVANDKLLEIIPPNTPLERAFGVADDILRQVQYIVHYISYSIKLCFGMFCVVHLLCGIAALRNTQYCAAEPVPVYSAANATLL